MSGPNLDPKTIRRAQLSGRKITPSHMDPWHGDPAPGSRWTVQQEKTVRAEGRNPDTIKGCMVPVLIQNQLDWAMPYQTIYVHCPELARTKGGIRALIVMPIGDKAWMKV